MASTRANIHGQTLEVIVVAGTKLKNMSLVGTQGPFVELIYGASKYRTNICKVKGTETAFHDKFMIEFVQGLHHIKISAYNRNASSNDDFIGEGKIMLDEVLQKGCQDTICHLKKNSRPAGEIRLILMYPNAKFSYEEMRAAKEKAEAELISYRNSMPELELKTMKVKMAEKEEELISLREELDGLKKELETANMIRRSEQIASQRLVAYELAMKQLHLELDDVREKLDRHCCQGCKVSRTEELVYGEYDTQESKGLSAIMM